MAKSNTRITADKDEVALYTYEYTATSGQTTFSGSDDNSNTLDYTAGSITVSYGGLELPESDYTATNGTSIVLADGAVAGEIIRVVAYEPFVVSDALPITGGTLTGALDVTVADNSLVTLSNSSTAAVNNASQIDFKLLNSFSGANVDVQVGALKTNSGNSESAFFVKTTSGTGTPAERMRIDSSGSVGIGTTSPFNKLHVKNGASGRTAARGGSTTKHLFENSGNQYTEFAVPQNSTTNGLLFSGVNSNYGLVNYDNNTQRMEFYTDSNPRLEIDAKGFVKHKGNVHVPIASALTSTQHGVRRVVLHKALGAAGGTTPILRVKQGWWGSGHFEIRVRETYYSGQQAGVYELTGSTSIQHNQTKSIQTVRGWTGQLSIGSRQTASPADSNTGYQDISIVIPAYKQHSIEITVTGSTFCETDAEMLNLGNCFRLL